jgi:hypothetical protein
MNGGGEGVDEARVEKKDNEDEREGRKAVTVFCRRR